MRPDEVLSLMVRYCALGRLLPSVADVADRIDEARLLLAEMAVVQAKIDGFFASKRVS